MATKSIDVELLAKMFLAGAQNIEAKKEYINELNVFPVPDGDTGTNMSMTIMAAAKEVTALEGMDMASLAKAISSGWILCLPRLSERKWGLELRSLFLRKSLSC